ncbi:MAG: hypothetical protein ACK2T6_03185, partial [Anaerolineae bacterium]
MMFASWVHLPVLNYVGDREACSTWINLHLVGSAPKKAVLFVWGEPGFCPPQQAGPLTIECTGLIRPGATWAFAPSQIPRGAVSGVLFALSARRLSEFDLDLVYGFDAVLADVVCATLWQHAAGCCGDYYEPFRMAYQEGGVWEGLPMDLAAGINEGGVLTAEVRRECVTGGDSSRRAASSYSGLRSVSLGRADRAGSHGYFVPSLRTGDETGTSMLYVHNAGLECATVELWLKPQDDCAPARLCADELIAAGETLNIDPQDCVGGGWRGSGWFRSSKMLAVVVDEVGPSTLASYVAEPEHVTHIHEPTCEVDPRVDEIPGSPDEEAVYLAVV